MINVSIAESQGLDAPILSSDGYIVFRYKKEVGIDVPRYVVYWGERSILEIAFHESSKRFMGVICVMARRRHIVSIVVPEDDCVSGDIAIVGSATSKSGIFREKILADFSIGITDREIEVIFGDCFSFHDNAVRFVKFFDIIFYLDEKDNLGGFRILCVNADAMAEVRSVLDRTNEPRIDGSGV